VSFNEATLSVVNYSSHEVDLEEEDLDIPWNELILKENIGTGTVFETLCKIYRVKNF
jgi:serine/threonine-protein kinase CTR1